MNWLTTETLINNVTSLLKLRNVEYDINEIKKYSISHLCYLMKKYRARKLKNVDNPRNTWYKYSSL